ncbi:hypothetical protein KFL_002890120 [Klebsormidium nitens]|uniref:CxC3 like cysteine cluster domain-containing protein n=1 Tax=Klebsormidium nitens TaxID=105231 RepID=A0A1Y1I659_KLENI|nr:hypothetical protein KFL_002890120 [Klebsormidium nitens]|eukprot:GAQ86445.1 hypothetical protein KFL_002890120 [Klebsormidium nitens]
MDTSESSEEQLSELSSPAVSSSSSERAPQTHLPSKRKQDEVPIDSEEESGDVQSRESLGRTASRSLSGSGAASSSRERSVSCDGRERMFADGVPVTSAAPRPERRGKPQNRSVPPVQDPGASSQGVDAKERTSGRNDGGSGVDHRRDNADGNPRSAGDSGTAPRPVWFEEEVEEAEGQPDWAVRTEREYRAYVEGRQSIAAELLRQEAVPGDDESGCSCQGCQGVGILRCQECTGGRAICAECDEGFHPHAHFHHRSILKAEGFWSPLSPTKAVVNGQLNDVAKCFSQPPLRPCAHCKQTSWGPAQAVADKWAVITLEGRFDFHKAAFKCQTEGCPCLQIQDGVEALQLGYWVGTVTKVVTLYSVAMLKHWDKVQKHMPGSGLSAFVKILEETGQELGREGPINRHTLGLACSEFKFAKYEFASLGRMQTGLECPACYLDLHSIISDGNRKLYRWDRSYALFQDCYYGELLIFEDESVLRTLEALDLQLGVSRPDAQCGGKWKAARDTRSAIRGQAETGAVFCGCRHQVAMKAVNLVRSGERFGYTYFLDRHFIQGRHPRFFWQDIICKYWPWREKALDNMGEDVDGVTKPALNIMHGKLHSWPCQAVFGGRWQKGAGAGSGEDMELFFSYMSRFGLVTKNMGAARRGERITEATLYWNEDKRAAMAKSLAKRLDQTKFRVVAAAQDLDRLCQETLQISESEVPLQKFEEWKSEVQQIAKEQLSRSGRAPSAAVKYFSLVTEVEAARELEAFRQSGSFEDSLLCSETVQQVRSLTAEVVRDLHLKERKLKELERSLFSGEVGPSIPEGAKQKVLEASRTELAELTILGLQVEVEALLHSLEKYKSRIASEADSAKMRASMRKKEGEEESRLLVDEQRSLLTYYSDLIVGLDKRIEQLDSLDSRADAEAPAESELEGRQSRYWISESRLKNDRDARNGCRALHAQARAAAAIRLREAKKSFPHALEEASAEGSGA